jgi:hypothetical protein
MGLGCRKGEDSLAIKFIANGSGFDRRLPRRE